MTRRLAMIGGWTDIYTKAKRLGLDLTLLQKKAAMLPEDFLLADQVVTCDLESPAVPELLSTLHAVKPFDAVVSFQELGVINATVTGERLGVAHNAMRPVMLTTDKGAMRAHLAAHGIATIPFVVADSVETVTAFGRDCGWPIILKPIEGTGSKQIHKLHEEAEVAGAYAAIMKDFPNRPPIAEKFIVGPEVSVEAFSWKGEHAVLTVTDKTTSGAPYFVETGHSMPSALAPETVAAIKHMTEAFLVSIGHLSGPSHTEVIVTESGPIIIESHTRTGGDRIFEMVELAHGVDMIGATLQGLAGQTPQVNPTRERGAAIRYLILPEGTVESVAGLADAAGSEGVVRCDTAIEAGARISDFKNSNERHGYVLAIGKDRADAVRNAEAALAKIDVTMSANP